MKDAIEDSHVGTWVAAYWQKMINLLWRYDNEITGGQFQMQPCSAVIDSI